MNYAGYEQLLQTTLNRLEELSDEDKMNFWKNRENFLNSLLKQKLTTHDFKIKIYENLYDYGAIDFETLKLKTKN